VEDLVWTIVGGTKPRTGWDGGSSISISWITFAMASKECSTVTAVVVTDLVGDETPRLLAVSMFASLLEVMSVGSGVRT